MNGESHLFLHIDWKRLGWAFIPIIYAHGACYVIHLLLFLISSTCCVLALIPLIAFFWTLAFRGAAEAFLVYLAVGNWVCKYAREILFHDGYVLNGILGTVLDTLCWISFFGRGGTEYFHLWS